MCIGTNAHEEHCRVWGRPREGSNITTKRRTRPGDVPHELCFQSFIIAWWKHNGNPSTSSPLLTSISFSFYLAFLWSLLLRKAADCSTPFPFRVFVLVSGTHPPPPPLALLLQLARSYRPPAAGHFETLHKYTITIVSEAVLSRYQVIYRCRLMNLPFSPSIYWLIPSQSAADSRSSPRALWTLFLASSNLPMWSMK